MPSKGNVAFVNDLHDFLYSRERELEDWFARFEDAEPRRAEVPGLLATIDNALGIERALFEVLRLRYYTDTAELIADAGRDLYDRTRSEAA